MSIASYRQFIQWLFGFYAPLETQLMTVSSWKAVGLDYGPRQKTPRLRQDLLALGDTDTIIEALPRCDHLPPLMSEAQLWGCLYVIEGATLGGQIIMKHLHRNLGLSANSGGSFFDGYGCETGPQWKAFCAAITTYGEDATGGRNAMLSSANHTFDALSEWLFPGSVAWSGAGPETLSYAPTSAQREGGAEHAAPSAHR